MKIKNKFIKRIFFTLCMALMLSMPLTAAAASCTSWETYSTTEGNCTTAWCNPIWKPSGLKQNVTYHQSRICNEGGGNYVLEFRDLDTTECNC